MVRKIKIDRATLYEQIKNTILVTLGCLILAFGSAAFIVPADLLTGGINSIAITIQYVLKHYYDIDFMLVDIVTFVLEVVLFFVGLAVLGKKFSAHTLWASLIYPAFFALFYRTGWLKPISDAITVNFAEQYLGILLCAVFGGVCVGAGVAITFLGGGSTGGVDILVVILGKYTPIKESIGTMIVDYSIILVGIIVRYQQPDIIPLGLLGLTSAFVAAFLIQVLYVSSNTHCLVEIISSKSEEIIKFIQEKLDRGCTIFAGEGGYTGEGKRVVRVALSKKQSDELKAFVSALDDRAFMMITPNLLVNGEGFVPFATSHASLLRRFIAPKASAEIEKRDKE